ncbi:MAG: lipopolysaccharide heptosyltransferase II [Planctomycetes bacterium]|nr:lipopolysaccharide heptosyltransferase II [Planctomycetota bacterium]
MKLAVFLPGWIGDVVMATPAIRALRQLFPDAHLLGVCKPYVAEVLDGAPWLDDVIFLDGKGPWKSRWPAVVWKLRRTRIAVAVLFPNSFRSAWVTRLGGCRRRIGFERYGRGVLLTDRLRPQRDAGGRLVPSPVIDDYNLLAETAGCPWPGYRMELFTTARDEAAADRLYSLWKLDGEVICLNPGAAFGSAKHWPTESFAELARLLVERLGQKILVFCGPRERETASRIVAMAQRPGVYSLADQQVSIGLTKALVRRCRLLITTDSGPRHFAAAFDRPVITLFGPTHIEWTETYYARAVHLQKRVPCGPCQLRACPLDHRCMKELTPAEVLAAAEDLLRREAQTAA